MSIRWLAIKPEEPLLLGNVKSNTNFLSTLDYIPGRRLRGAWAGWLIANGFLDNITEKIKQLQIGNFFPVAKWREIEYVSPFLLSMLTCKQNSGFQTEPHMDNRGHGIMDSLLLQLTLHLLEEKGARISTPFSIKCQDQSCESRMEHEGGFYSAQLDGTITRYIKSRPRYHTQTRAALSRFRNASYEGMLYTTTAISPKIERPDDTSKEAELVFVGRVQGADDKIKELMAALDSTPIGSKCSIGYGSISCKDEQINLPSIDDRLAAFNKLIIDLWGDLKRLASNGNELPERPEEDFIYFSLDLMAPAILRDSFGLPSMIPNLQIGGRTVEPIFWLTRPDFAGGWSDAWGLPKQTALAARMGSSYVFRMDGSKEGLVDALEHIESVGIGERCDEGFGECWICHPFHQEVREK